MKQIMSYVKPELIIVAVVLYFLGKAIKQSQSIKDKLIPFINGTVGIILCGIWALSINEWDTAQEIAALIFTAFTQGVLAAGLSTYVHQIIKQAGNDK